MKPAVNKSLHELKSSSSLRIALVCASGLLATACTTTLEGPKIDYRSEPTRSPSLEVPPGLSQVPADDRYSVPGHGKSSVSASGQAESTGVAPSGVLPSVKQARVEREGNARWIVVALPAEKVWPVAKEFWTENGFTLQIDNETAGVMETDWAENRAKLPQDFLRRTFGRVLGSIFDSGMRDRFRTRLERTAAGETEITITHRGTEEIANAAKDGTNWQSRGRDPELEAEFMQRMLVRFGTAADQAKAAVVGADSARSGIERARRVKTSAGTDAIELDDAFDRSWRRVGLALDRIGFTVESRDRASGAFLVRFVDPEKAEKEQSFFARIFGLKAEVITQQFRIEVKSQAKGALVSVVPVESKDKAAAADAKTTPDRIVGLLFDELK
jgi:outer membrane protein assembly factor BamC